MDAVTLSTTWHWGLKVVKGAMLMRCVWGLMQEQAMAPTDGRKLGKFVGLTSIALYLRRKTDA
jgi:hypothetical protein